MENYIVINGKKAELTKEQLEKLGIKPKRNNPFDRVEYGEIYTSISTCRETVLHYDYNDQFDIDNIRNANYFNDEEFAKQMSLKSLLNRKLERYAWNSEAEDVEWNSKNCHYFICYNQLNKDFDIITNSNWKGCGVVYFSNKKVAQGAIKDVIEPFIAEHPEFKW